MKAREDVQMILGSIYAVEMAFAVLQDAPDIAEKILTMVDLERGDALFGRKDNVITNLRMR
jgi:hypothetical protein